MYLKKLICFIFGSVIGLLAEDGLAKLLCKEEPKKESEDEEKTEERMSVDTYYLD